MPEAIPPQTRPRNAPGLLRPRVWRWLGVVAVSLAAGVALLRLDILPDAGSLQPGWVATGASGVLAFLLCWVTGHTLVWRLAAAAAPPVAALFILYTPPLWVLPVLLILLAGVFWNVRSERVPLYLTNRQTIEAVAGLTDGIQPAMPLKIIDLGCGLGGTVRALAGRLPDAQVVGIENAPLLFVAGWLRCAILGPKNAAVRYGSLWSVDLGRYAVVYCFLSSEPMPRLIEKASQEIKPGCILVSNTFTDLTNTADEVVLVGDSRETHLNVWRF